MSKPHYIKTTSRFLVCRMHGQPLGAQGAILFDSLPNGQKLKASYPLPEAYSFAGYQSTYFSTIPSDDNSTPNHHNNEEVVENMMNEMGALAKEGQGRKVEEVLQRFLQLNKNNGNFLSTDKLTTCYNLALWGCSLSADVDSAQRASTILKSMIVKPNELSYRYMLKCWSRVKQTKRKLAGQEAERCLRKLKFLGVEDLWSAYHLTLKACTKTADGERAIRLLQEMSQLNQEESTASISKHIVSTVLMALKSNPVQAEALLDNLEQNLGMKPDFVHYCTVMNAWASARQGPRVEALIKKMIAKGIKPDVGAMRALMMSWRDNLDRQEQLFRALIDDYLECPYRNGSQPSTTNESDNNIRTNEPIHPPAIEPDVESLSIVLNAQAHANAPERAEALLNWVMSNPEISTFLKPNVVCFTSVIHAWARMKQPKRAEALLRQIIRNGYEPNVITYTTTIQAWASVGEAERAKALWEEMVSEQNIGPNHHTLNNLVLAYANAKQPEGAEKALEQAAKDFGLVPDLTSYCTLMRAWNGSNQPHKAREILEELRQREAADDVDLLDLIAYNTVFQGYSSAGMPDEANELLSQMLEGKNTRKIRPDVQSFSQVLSAYTKSEEPHHREMAGERAESLIKVMQARGVEPNRIAFNVFLHCYATSGLPERAEIVFKNMLHAPSIDVDVVTLNTCLNAWALAGDALRAEKLLFEIGADRNRNKRGNNIEPNVQSFTIVLAAWARQGSIEDAEHAEELLRRMAALDERCKPDTVAYNAVIQAYLTAATTIGSEDAARVCAACADRLFCEMENHARLNGGGNTVRPDRITFSRLIKLLHLAGHHQRAMSLKKKSQNSNGVSPRRGGRDGRI